VSRRPPPRERGFTLLEVVVAFTVAALVVAAAFQVFGTAFGGSARAERQTLALLTAESKLAEVGHTLPLAAGTRNGDAPGDLAWTVRIVAEPEAREADGSRGPVRTYAVTVTVRWGARDAEAVTLNTLRLGPRTPNA
jgi:general secretion pathway protein I